MAETILYLCPWVDVGGTDRSTVDHLAALDRSRYEAICVTTVPSPNRALSRVLPAVAELWPLAELLPGRQHSACVADLIRSRRVGLVHISNSRLGLDLLPEIASLPHPPARVVQVHEAREDGLTRYAATRYDSLVDAYSAVSHETSELLGRMGVSPTKRHVIHIGVDMDEFAPDRTAPTDLGDGSFHVLWPGRLAEQKDPLLMVRIADRLRARVPGAVVHAVGEGPLERQARELGAGLDGGLRFHPVQPQGMSSWYRAADAVLLTSRYEGIPLVACEALAMGRSLVAPALPGLRELTGDECGRLVEPGEPAEAYVERLAELAADPALRDRLGREGRRRVAERFTSRHCADAHMALYDRLLARR